MVEFSLSPFFSLSQQRTIFGHVLDKCFTAFGVDGQ